MYGGIYNKDGIDVEKLLEHVNKTGTVCNFEGTTSITNEELLTMEVDILALAALENQITSANAPDVKAKIICEGANGPTTPEADKILAERGVFVVRIF